MSDFDFWMFGLAIIAASWIPFAFGMLIGGMVW